MLQPITLAQRRIRKTKHQDTASVRPVHCRLPSTSAAPVEEDSSPFSSAYLSLKQSFQALWSDFQVVFERDPAARNWVEVLCCYPGLHAIAIHRIAHWLHSLHLPFIPRFLSHIGRFLTGIEIHPGATLGKGVFIDHGMGVVIGETAIIGDYCLIYQNATLGGTGKESGKRHPTLGHNVVVGAGAKVLGNLQIGSHVRIGAGSIVLRDVPDDCTVVGIPGRVISRSGKGSPLEHGQLPDVEAKLIRTLLDRIEQLEQQVQTLNNKGPEVCQKGKLR